MQYSCPSKRNNDNNNGRTLYFSFKKIVGSLKRVMHIRKTIYKFLTLHKKLSTKGMLFLFNVFHLLFMHVTINQVFKILFSSKKPSSLYLKRVVFLK